ncbi:TFIIB-type zinc finger domain-containing protein [Levyella massiliensis]|uniref:TFIIB-type zinc finger domain-containing protein n=1 Tax=Levyella massiliensis TaxID=938289 RepID=UPI003EB90D5F
MKQITCEMCGSHDLIKQDGLFICQHCGMKYSLEEAQKLIIEGVVDVSGSTVKIDESEKIQNILMLARRAVREDNRDDAIKYYEMIAIKDPSNWESTFYPLYYRAFNCSVDDLKHMFSSLLANLKTVLVLITQSNMTEIEKEDNIKQIHQAYLSLIASIARVITDYANDSNIASRIRNENLATYGIYLASFIYSAGDKFYALHDNVAETANVAVSLWKQGINVHLSVLNLVRDEKPHYKVIREVKEKINKLDKEYSLPERHGACYIATAVYGSYNCPPVWTLRRYRDFYLKKTSYGRAFIRFYYAISPRLVSMFGNSTLIHKWTKKLLDQFVNYLNRKGISSGYYKD